MIEQDTTAEERWLLVQEARATFGSEAAHQLAETLGVACLPATPCCRFVRFSDEVIHPLGKPITVVARS